MKSTFVKGFLSLCMAAAVSAGCEKSKSRQVDDVKSPRKGEQLVTPGLKYFDGKPALSADGSRVVFISGRDLAQTDDSGAALRAYSAQFAIGGEVGVVSRITPPDFVASETDVQVTADGAHAVVTAQVGGQSDLYLYDFDGVGEALTSTAAIEINPRFSPDSKLLAWTQVAEGDAAMQNTSIGLVDLTDPSQVYAFTVDSGDPVLLAWIPQSSGYQMIVSVGTATGGGRVLKALSFAKAADFSESVLTAWGSEVSSYQVSVNVGKETVIMPKFWPSGAKTATTFGDTDGVATETVSLISSPLFLSRSGSEQSAVDVSIGYEFVSASLSAAADFGLFLSRIRMQCQADQGARFATALSLYRGAGQAVDFLIPLNDESKLPVALTGSFCQRELPDGGVGKVDGQIAMAAINGSATRENFRIVYQTTGSGDAEVRLIDEKDGSRTVKSLSANMVE